MARAPSIRFKGLLVGLGLAILPGPALAAVPEENNSHDYPTQIRVRYAIECMERNGGMSFGNLYKCSCTIDRIAEDLTVSEFVHSETYLRGADAAGERAEILREGRGAESAREKLLRAEQEAVQECFPDSGGTGERSGGEGPRADR